MYDILIIGGGPAGLTAALYAARYGLDTVMLESLYPGGQIITTTEIENYPGFLSTTGPELISDIEKQVRRLGVPVINEAVTSVRFENKNNEIKTAKQTYAAKAVIIATGQSPRELGVEGERELRGRGVSYCATCDGNFFRNKEVAVVGGGDTAVIDAVFLSRICKKVTLIHRRDTFRAAKAEVDKLMVNVDEAPMPVDRLSTGVDKPSANRNVSLKLNTQVTRLIADGMLSAAEITSNDGQKELLAVSGLFVAVGASPNSSLFAGLLELDPSGHIVTDEDMATGLPGVYAAGDIRHKSLRQVVTATADGAIAAHAAARFIGQ